MSIMLNSKFTFFLFAQLKADNKTDDESHYE